MDYISVTQFAAKYGKDVGNVRLFRGIESVRKMLEKPKSGQKKKSPKVLKT